MRMRMRKRAARLACVAGLLEVLSFASAQCDSLAPLPPAADSRNDSLFDPVVSLGDLDAFAGLLGRLRDGKPLRAIAIGGSVTAYFGGCIGSGCNARESYMHAGLQGVRGNLPHSRIPQGHLAGFVRWLNVTFPHDGHSLRNNAIGGSTAAVVWHCIRTFVEEPLDVVFIDYAINGGQPSDFRNLATQLSLFRPVPVMVATQNTFWHQKPKLADQTGIDVAAASCGMAVLSHRNYLQPKFDSGEQTERNITRDGKHPSGWHQSDNAPFSKAWTEILEAWFTRATTAVDACARAPAGRALAVQEGACKPSAQLRLMAHCYTPQGKTSPRPWFGEQSGWAFSPYDESDVEGAQVAGRKPRQKPGWVSTRVGSYTHIRLQERGELDVRLFLLHSWNQSLAGLLGISCVGGCACDSLQHDTHFALKQTTFEDVGMRVHSSVGSEGGEDGGCQLRLEHISGARHKLGSVIVASALPEAADVVRKGRHFLSEQPPTMPQLRQQDARRKGMPSVPLK